MYIIEKKKLEKSDFENLILVLKDRFNSNMHRHRDIIWEDVEKRILENRKIMETIFYMEKTSGEPDVVEYNKDDDMFIYCDCSKESPKGRRSLCYDLDALKSRKKNLPKSDAHSVAKEIGINILNEEQYRMLQDLEEFDLKTSSWVETPEDVRRLGGSIFCDRRYGRIFTYHNGADSYYASRGFRGFIKF